MSQEVEKTDNRDARNTTSQQQAGFKSSLEVSHLRKWPTVVLAASLLSIAISGVWVIVWIGSAITDIAVKIGFITTSVLNLFVFLAIVAQACIYWGQRNLMALQWNAMERQLGNMEKQLEVLHKQAESAYIGERAYLIIEDIAFFEKGERPQVVLTLFNGGRTPAFKVTTKTEASVGPTSKPPTGKLQSFGHLHGEKAFIPANTKKQMVANFPNFTVTFHQWQMINARSVEFFLRGVGFYEDFQNVDSSISFCVGYDPSLNRFREYKAEEYDKYPN